METQRSFFSGLLKIGLCFFMLGVPAFSYTREMLKVKGIPSNWIVDPEGVVRLKGLGYDATEKWVTGMNDAIAKVAAAAPPATPSAN